jgi:poly-gamma-glutamate capsule biosynthesis protein CapA/YwtB (metallophosphatase superfamily)
VLAEGQETGEEEQFETPVKVSRLHVLDWGYAGLTQTLETLQKTDISSAGAGQNLDEAEMPAVMEVEDKGRVLVFSYGLGSSGIPASWAASEDRPGVNLLENLSDQTVRHIKEQVEAVKQAGDIVVASIHWGDNWGYDIPPAQTEFAHKLIDEAGVEVIHGHSSHHVKGIEVYVVAGPGPGAPGRGGYQAGALIRPRPGRAIIVRCEWCV